MAQLRDRDVDGDGTRLGVGESGGSLEYISEPFVAIHLLLKERWSLFVSGHVKLPMAANREHNTSSVFDLYRHQTHCYSPQHLV